MRYNLTDLHMHSFCSDGLRTPTQAVEEACEAGLQAISLTDHDTVEGIPEATEAGIRLGMEVIPGTELSAHVREREVHILAYCRAQPRDGGGGALYVLLRRRRAFRE